MKDYWQDKQENQVFALSEKNYIVNALMKLLDKLQLIAQKEEFFY